MVEYMPDYKPEGEQAAFDDMLKFLNGSTSTEMLSERTVLFIMDVNMPRQDIHVASRKVEREKGWG